MVKKMVHITANVKKYVETNKTPFLALLQMALSNVIIVIIAIGPTMDAIAKGTTAIRTWGNPLNVPPHSDFFL